MIRKKASGLSVFGKIVMLTIYRTLVLVGLFFAGHMAFGIHWALAIVIGAAGLAAVMKFWSPSKVLD